jgi:hypothetical protein
VAEADFAGWPGGAGSQAPLSTTVVTQAVLMPPSLQAEAPRLTVTQGQILCIGTSLVPLIGSR